jgi:hypothetical protein
MPMIAASEPNVKDLPLPWPFVTAAPDSDRALSGIPGIVVDSVCPVRFRRFRRPIRAGLQPGLGDAFPPIRLNQRADPQPEEEQHPE